MKRAIAATLSLLLGTAALAQEALPLCVADPDAMPQSWRPATADEWSYRSPEPWSAAEARDAEAAIAAGLEEMLDLFDARENAADELWEDSVGALIEVTYAGANPPSLDAAARDGARDNLAVLIDSYFDVEPRSETCEDLDLTLPLAIYAQKFYQPGDMRIGMMAEHANAAYSACGSLTAAVGEDYPAIFEENRALTLEAAFDLVIWSLLFIEAELYPAIELPPESRAFSARLWSWLETYPLPSARSFADGAYDDVFVEVAYLATHIAYIPTGNHRHPIYIDDSPPLYRFHRENFYPVLEMGELDLVAEFVDSLRQYGCTPENDLQVRDGTRYLLEVFHDGNDRWMAYREDGETDADVDSYDLVHKAWTGILGVRERVIEPPTPGSYGAVVRDWLPAP